MPKIINCFLFIFPVIGLIAGLSLGATIPIFVLMILCIIRKDLRINFNNYKIDFLFFSFLLLSIFWSIDPIKSANSLFTIICIYLLFMALMQNISVINKKIYISERNLFYSLFAAILLFSFELLTDGSISTAFRQLTQNKTDYQFYLYYLDRGCAFITLFAWVVIAALLAQKKYSLSIITYLAILIMLSFSDSFAGFLSFFISGIVFILTQYFPFKNCRTLSIMLILGSFIFTGLSFKMDPLEASDNANFLPLSAKHRLFIWSYSAEKIIKKPLLGWGHGASRHFKIDDAEMINYQGHLLHPLPTHPHNNIIQILLENGFIGLILYLTLICKYLFQWDNLFKNKLNEPSIVSMKYVRSAGYACFSAYFLISMISFNMWQIWWLCSYLFAAFMLAQIAVSALHSHFSK